MSAAVWLPAIAAAGGAGAVIRHRVTAAAAARAVPGYYATAGLNLTGSAVFGVVTGLMLWHGLPTAAFLVLTVGVCGGLTTFSTSVVETVGLVRAGRTGRAAGQALGTLVLCCAAAAAGLAAASAWPAG